uniref:Uncharacterized protein n=1 Tax=Daucus carota subsp. sativus TaxID=79200 RepID=A0A166FQB2_DAUCS
MNGNEFHTARGSGTPGHIQNKFSIKPFTNKPLNSTQGVFAASKKANKDILQHDQR